MGKQRGERDSQSTIVSDARQMTISIVVVIDNGI